MVITHEAGAGLRFRPRVLSNEVTSQLFTTSVDLPCNRTGYNLEWIFPCALLLQGENFKLFGLVNLVFKSRFKPWMLNRLKQGGTVPSRS